jgi:hypothetical protein
VILTGRCYPPKATSSCQRSCRRDERRTRDSQHRERKGAIMPPTSLGMSRGIPGYPGGSPRGSAEEAGPVPPRPLRAQPANQSCRNGDQACPSSPATVRPPRRSSVNTDQSRSQPSFCDLRR